MDIHWNRPTSSPSEDAPDAESSLQDEAETWDVEIHIRRQGRRQGAAASVYAPRFPKVQLLVSLSQWESGFHQHEWDHLRSFPPSMPSRLCVPGLAMATLYQCMHHFFMFDLHW